VVVGGIHDELEQVLLNLCVNAIQAQPRGGRLECTVGREPSARGEVALVAVSDAGPGVPEALREKIFEAFFTTKDPAEGTGLGLALCDEVVRRQGGAVLVTDAPGGGARFEVRLPLEATEPCPARGGLA
jgi:signal transduction histidine kinase